MAESISEGTLKQFSKQIGDYVEQDEEIATIETDKVHRSCVDSCSANTYSSRSTLLSMLLKLAQSKSSLLKRRIL